MKNIKARNSLNPGTLKGEGKTQSMMEKPIGKGHPFPYPYWIRMYKTKLEAKPECKKQVHWKEQKV